MRIRLLVFITALLVLLVSCGNNTKDSEKQNTAAVNTGNVTDNAASQSSGTTDDNESNNEGDFRKLISDAVSAGNFGDSMELIFDDDEYAGDLLEFNYGIEPELAEKIEAYVLSEQNSMEAYSFAYFKFSSDAQSDDIEAVKTAINDVYVSGLKASLEAYNPEAYAMCDKAVYKETDTSLVFMICDEADIAPVMAIIGDGN